MTERALIAWIQQRAPQFGKRVRVGIGDDCAVYTPAQGYELVFTTDFTIEDRHFRWGEYRPAEAGWKALARALSDIAAMGAQAEFALVSLASKPEWIKGFMGGLFRCAKEYGVSIAGGDLTESPRLVCDITVAGRVKAGKAVLRSGAKPGDHIYVSGSMGRWKKKPVPRLDLAPILSRHASAAIDVSDGLRMDLDRLLLASGCGAELDGHPPVDRGATLEEAWTEGESYELLFTSAKQLDFPRLGHIVKSGQRPTPAGWDPFR